MSNHNASPSAFGWDFQINAAILLMLDNIEQNRSIKVEGKHEDIEVELNSGGKIYAQAKSVVKSDDYNNVIPNLEKSLKTLNDTSSKNNNIDKLIYITNTPNPFNNKETMNQFIDYTRLGFDDLPNICQEKINNILDKNRYQNIDTSLLYVYVLPFHGSDELNRYKIVRRELSNFLYRIDVKVSIDDLLPIWQNDLFHNATIADESIQLTKEDFIWPIIVLSFKKEIKIEELDFGTLQEINNQYGKIITYHSNKFKLVTKVLFDFNDFKIDGTPKEKYEQFIKTKYKNYIYEIYFGTDSNINEEIKEYVVKSIIEKILNEKFVIDRIKKEVNLSAE